MADPIANLITTYHELNASTIDELDEQPSALEFMRYVASNRPFVVRGGARDWDAVRKWDAAYLSRTLEGQTVNVSTTPLGNADAPVDCDDGSIVFVQPHDADEPFEEFLRYVRQDSQGGATRDPRRPVKYAQTQNDNLRDEYSVLFEDVPPSIDFARVSLEREPDAVNLWLGNSRSVTAVHKDNYENVYVQVRGQKHFTLLAPVEMPCVNERLLPQGRYRPSEDRDGGELEIVLDEAAGRLPVAIWDPDEPERRTTAYSRLSRPMKVTLDPGDMLYLPAMWFHKVGQSEGDEGFACAVNYWYDMDFGGSLWAMGNFVREIAQRQTSA